MIWLLGYGLIGALWVMAGVGFSEQRVSPPLALGIFVLWLPALVAIVLILCVVVTVTALDTARERWRK